MQNLFRRALTLLLLSTAMPLLASNPYMEKCHVVDQDGNCIIKPYSADSGPNLPGDDNAWIWVPYGQCAKINSGDYSSLTPEILNKLDLNNRTTAETVE